jgi:hypothetical protein
MAFEQLMAESQIKKEKEHKKKKEKESSSSSAKKPATAAPAGAAEAGEYGPTYFKEEWEREKR